MRTSDAEYILHDWLLSVFKIFKWVRLGPVEFVCIKKIDDNSYETIPDKSSYDLGKFDKEHLLKLLTSGELVFTENYLWTTGLRMKTGGCECGAWAIKDSAHSVPWCPQSYKNPFK